MKLLKNKNIAIVGGGPGGLTLARLLQMNGVEVKVYERDEHKDARSKGATLDLHEESGLKALGQAGLMDAFKANYRPGADKLRVVDQNGIIHFDDSEQSMENTYRPEIDRGPLQKILLDSLTPETVVWDSQFVSLNPEGKSLKIAFKNGRTVEADIVIAADGANSKIRSYITPIKPFYAGITILEGAVNDSAKRSPTVHRLLNGGKIFALGSEKSLIVSSKGDGSLVFYTGCKTEENWVNDCGINFSDKSEVISWFKNTFKDWGEIWLELFENTSTPFVPRPQYCMPLDQNWEALPNLTILGDAAHLMPPYAGEGVNMAMLDALELSNCLLSDMFPDTKSAIAMYEKQMLNRASFVAKQTLDSTDALHAPDAVSWIIDLFSED
ncbi:2-polyprenyl-6-methoxyphenol hydroxylase [Dyadobacter koreensis]|uniref:Flavin-dependent monooxygenase n=1 Tax=Dyadobacter koreensis TaxID=408657 RepID=A0A1H6QBV4_9BACT|nr:NAD(P)/FAD-dependent oxidoreductase [Dyadobacter koreensis]SEI37090.1 2-polyprenyl-6-methoxyphenol hydroxylase [Dyadobacter koreensis]